MRLRPVQALAIHAALTVGGLFGPMRVGAGKTLTSLLIPYVLDAKRPILLLPAHLIEKTKIEMAVLEKHWILPRNLRMVSYQALGREGEARAVVQDMRDELTQVREFSSVWPDRPRVYFEEWHEPLIAGIRWVSEIIDIGGGRDVFPELREQPMASGRVVDADEVVRRDPEIILASWCGKKVDVESIRARPGWDAISAVRAGRIYEVDGSILSPGPSVMAGLRQVHEIIQESLT